LAASHWLGYRLGVKNNSMQHIHRMVLPDRVRPNPHNARVYSKKHIQVVADSIRAFGFAACRSRKFDPVGFAL
jgi:hypothetical protein